MGKERLYELLSRKLSGEATEIELEELNQWLQQHPDDQYFTEILLAYWLSANDSTSHRDDSPDQHFQHILAIANDNNGADIETPVIAEGKAVIRFRRFAIAASIAALLVVAAWFVYNSGGKAQPIAGNDLLDIGTSEVVAKKGARSRIVLPDGTHVWLNSDSRIVYDHEFNEKIREVRLEGEAFFDVVKDPERPFIVHTSGINVKVLGTVFNLKSYPQDSTIEATLITGLIEVTNTNEQKSPSIILEPQKKLVFNKQKNVFETDARITQPQSLASAIAITPLPPHISDTSLVETSWVFNRLLFDGETFRELAVKMERWFDVKINFKSEKVANYRMRGVFTNENIEEALKLLQVISSFNYKIKNNEIEISNK